MLALWIAHTWAFEAATVTPYVWLYSPEMGSGKTRTLEVIELLVRAPWRAIEPREAVLFRKIAVEKPTLLLDEVDVMFAKDRKGGRASSPGEESSTLATRGVHRSPAPKTSVGS